MSDQDKNSDLNKLEQDKTQVRQQGEIVMDVFIRLAALERILMAKNLVTETEIVDMLKTLSDELMAEVKSKLEASGVRLDKQG